MASINRLKPEQILFVIGKIGNSKLGRKQWYEVRVIEIGEGFAIASWNGNPPRKFLPQDVKKWRVSNPLGKEE